METNTDKQSFWEHLDVLRTAIVKITVVAIVFTIIAFCFKEELFTVVLAPKNESFITYCLFNRIAAWVGGETESFAVQLINTGLAQQFIIHMKTALCAGVLCTSLYILYQLFRFASPALYANERKYVMRVAGGGYAMFVLGILVGYFLIFPLTFRFLSTYQVIGFLSAYFMRKYRKHVIVVILIIAAVITPTSDLFTLLLAVFPMWLLYEVSIFIVKYSKVNEVIIAA